MKGALLAAAALVVAGCANMENASKDNGEYVERYYRTGSNIPTKTSPQADGVQVMTKDEVDKWQMERSPSGVPCGALGTKCGGLPGSR
jgi:hypothetical protein